VDILIMRTEIRPLVIEKDSTIMMLYGKEQTKGENHQALVNPSLDRMPNKSKATTK
jgi:hypothetical protein